MPKVVRRNIIRVSDHALLKLLERAGGMDVESFRARVEASMARAMAAADNIGGGHFRILADGLVYLVRDNVIVTVLTGDMPLADQGAPARPPEDA